MNKIISLFLITLFTITFYLNLVSALNVIDRFNDGSINTTIWNIEERCSGCDIINETSVYAQIYSIGANGSASPAIPSNLTFKLTTDIFRYGRNITYNIFEWVHSGTGGSDGDGFVTLKNATTQRILTTFRAGNFANRTGNLWVINDEIFYSFNGAGVQSFNLTGNRSIIFSVNGTSGTADHYMRFNNLLANKLINLNIPLDLSSLASSSIIFNSTFYADPGSSLINSSLYVWYLNNSLALINTSSITGTSINNSIWNITSLNNNQYKWNVYICDSTSCSFANSNSTFTYGLAVNNISFINPVYETDNTNYNISFNSSFTPTGRLWFNATSYTGSLVSIGTDIWRLTRNLDIPLGVGTKNIFWEIISGSVSFNLSNDNQNVLPINLTLCSATPQNIPYINFTFRDESTLASINASTDLATFEYYLGTGNVTKTLLYQEPTEQNNYTFCFSPPDRTLKADISYQYSATNYPQRSFTNLYEGLTNTTTNQVLYLLSSDDGIYVTIQTVNNLGFIVSGVEVTVERDIAGTPVVVGQGITDSAGSVTFWLNPNFEHTFLSSKDGCTASEFSVTPTQTTYTITLSCEGDTSYDTSPIQGIIFQKSPPSGPIAPGNTTFRYSVRSVAENVSISKAKFQLLHANGTSILVNETLVSSALPFCTSTQCNLTLTYDLEVGGDIKGMYFVDVGDGYVLLEGDARWRTIRAYPTRTLSLKNAFQDLKTIFAYWTEPTCSYSNDGLVGTNCSVDDIDLQNKLEFSRFVFFFLVLSILLAVYGRFTGYDGANPGIFIYIVGGLIIIGRLIGGIDSEGFFYYSNLTPFHFLNNYILAFTMIMMMIGYWAMLSRRQT